MRLGSPVSSDNNNGFLKCAAIPCFPLYPIVPESLRVKRTPLCDPSAFGRKTHFHNIDDQMADQCNIVNLDKRLWIAKLSLRAVSIILCLVIIGCCAVGGDLPVIYTLPPPVSHQLFTI